MKKHYHNFSRSIRKIWNTVYFKFQSFAIVKHILFFYLLITIGGGAILRMDISQQNPDSIHFIDTLFIAASAFSDTGLVTVETASSWTTFGQAVIAVLIFSGGVGVFALKVYLFNILLNRPMTMFIRGVLTAERGGSKLGSTRSLITVSVTAMFLMIIVGTIMLMFYFYYVPGDFTYTGPGMNNQGIPIVGDDSKYSPFHNWNQSIKFGMFHSISALDNAGFDIMGANSIAPYYTGYYVQIVFLVLLVTGGIGYPVIYDVFSYLRSKAVKQHFRFSLFTKLSCVTYFSIAAIGLSLTFAFEILAKDTVVSGSPGNEVIAKTFWHNPDNGTTTMKSMALFFNTMSTRNAGFASIGIKNLTNQTIMLYSILMFLGSAPSSTAGGIRTTTFAIILLALWRYIRNKSSVRAFHRRIPGDVVNRAFAVFAASVILVFIGLIVCSTSFDTFNGRIPSTQFNYIDVLFEVCSAFGTTGLSTGITPLLNSAAKITLILIMFIGQLGISSTLLVWGNKRQRSRHYRYIHEDVIIG